MKKSEIKESFLIKKECWNVIQRWTIEQKAELMDAMFEYQISGDYHTKSERVEDMMITLIEYRKKKDENYDMICEQNRQIALQRWAKKKEKIRKNTNVYERIRTDTNYTDIDKDIDNKKEVEEKKSTTTTTSQSEWKELYGKNIRLSKIEYEKLVKRYGQKIVNRYITYVDSYIAEHWKNYKDHYLTLLKWMAKDEVPEVKQSEELPDFQIEDGVYDLDKMNEFYWTW